MNQEIEKLEEVEKEARRLFNRIGKVVSTAIGKKNGVPVVRVAVQGKLKGDGPKIIDGIEIQKIVLKDTLKY